MRARTLSLAITLVGCETPPEHRAPVPAPARCERAFAEKLGVPFVRVCPSDLPGAVTAPFWIAAAPVGCTGGEHETIACPPIVALAPSRPGATAIEPRLAQVIDAEPAHRTCTLRFGGRLPTTAERAQARDAVGLVTLLVTEDTNASRHLDVLPEWTTAEPCLVPATLATSCAVRRFPLDTSDNVAWTRVRSCRATPASREGALVITPQESCPITPPPQAPRCLVAATPATRAFSLDCRALRGDELAHPETTASRAAFRCVVPEGALVGTIVTK